MKPEKQWYQIYIEGHVGPGWSDYFHVVDVQHTSDGQTVLTGKVMDQAGLHAVLTRIRDLGLTLLELRLLPDYPESNHKEMKS